MSNSFIMTESIVRPAKMPYGRLKDNGFVGIEGEHAARALVVETKDDLSAFASVNLIIDDLDCGAMTKVTSGGTTTLSKVLTSSMIGRSGRKICQLIMVNSGNTVVQKSSQFEAYVGRANEIERSVDDGVTIIILSEAVTEMAREAAAAAAQEAAADVVADCQEIANAAAASAGAAAQSAQEAEEAAASIVVDATLDSTSTHAIQNKAVASAISELNESLGDVQAHLDAIVPGLSNEAKAALIACFDNVAWKDGDGSDYIANLSDALSDDQGYIGSIAFKLSKEGSAKPSGGLSISAITNTYQFIYNASGVENRVAIDVSAFAFCAGDIISLDDTDTYAFAIGKDGSGGDYWIGGGYVSTYPFVATSADIQDMKKMLVKRNDNAVMTSEDLEYILQCITLTRSINKTLVNLLVSYDNNPVIAEEDHLAAIRHHLTVTAVYSDMTQENVTLYRISGRTLRPGANTVKIVYGSKQVSVSVTVRVIDHFLLGIAGDSGVGNWGTSAETPEENRGYIAPLSAESDKLTYNISNKTFKAGDVISLGETYLQCAFGTNKTQTSYNNRLWIGGGFLSQNTYTLQSSDISDMKILYVKHRSESSIDTTSWRTRIASRIFVQRCS